MLVFNAQLTAFCPRSLPPSHLHRLQSIESKGPFAQYPALREAGATIAYGTATDPSTYPQGDFDVVYDNNGKSMEECKALIDTYASKVGALLRVAAAWHEVLSRKLRLLPSHRRSRTTCSWAALVRTPQTLLSRCTSRATRARPRPATWRWRATCARWTRRSPCSRCG